MLARGPQADRAPATNQAVAAGAPRGQLTARRAAALAGLAAVLVCLPALRGQFVIDDQYLIVQNPAIRSLGDIPGHFAHAWGGGLGPSGHTAVNAGYYRPLTSTLHTLEYAAFGPRPMPWHAVSIVLHGLCTALLTWLAARALGSLLAALGAGLLFAVHPVHTEAVAASCYQTTLLAALLVLIALAALARAADQPDRAWRWLLLAGLATLLAGLAKEEALVAPLFGAAWLLVVPPRAPKRLVAGGLASMASAALLVAGLRATVVTGSQITFFGSAGLGVIAPTMLGVLALYARLLAFPLQLCPFYDWFIVPPSSSITVDVVLGAVLVVGVAGAIWMLRRRMPAVALGLAWLAMGLLPVLHFVPLLNVAAERFLYLPSAGFVLALTALLTSARPKAPRAVLAVGLLVIACFAARTLWRWPDWQDDQSLNHATAEGFPETPTPLLNLAEMEAAAGNLAAATRLLEQAEKRAPGWPGTHMVAARILSAGMTPSRDPSQSP